MKPTFALDLTSEAIALLHRTPKGWLSIGEVAFDAADLDEALDYLRKTALGLSPMGMACKVILPNSQILYTEVEAPGPGRNDKRGQIAAALESRTPYPVEDLVFDWSGKGAVVKVAVVARETLAEAEAFAVAHRLNPVSFVAVPEAGTFVGEPWFGPTAAAETLLAPGEAVDRDREPVTILRRSLPAGDEVPAATMPAPAVADADDAPLPGLEEALNADLPAEPAMAEPVAEPTPDPVTADAADDPRDAETGAVHAPHVAEDAELAAALATDEVDVDEPVQDAQPSPDLPLSDLPAPDQPAPAQSAADAVPPDAEEAPFAHVTDPSAFPDGDDDSPAGSAAAHPSALDDIPPAPASAAMAAFASRRAAGAPVTGAFGGVTRDDAAPAVARPAVAARSGQPIPRPVVGKSSLVTAPSIPGTRSKVKGRAAGSDAAASGPSLVKSPARPGGTFGTASPPRSRSGVALMVLVALLLLFLAALAALSSFYLSRNGQTVIDTGAIQLQDDAAPAVDDEMLADLQDPEGMTAPLPEADAAAAADLDALTTESLPVNIGGDETPAAAETVVEVLPEAAADLPDTAAAEAEAAPPLAEAAPDPVAAVAPEPAPGTTVTTELSAAEAPVEDQDEIFLSAMDAPPPALDALALPVPAAVVDALPDPVMPPPAFGTVYQFGADGLLKPTTEGIVSPEGVMLIAGKPPVLPPARSEVAAAAALAAVPAGPADATVVADPAAADASLVTAGEAGDTAAPVADPAMAGFRPRARPEGLAPATADDDAALTAEPTGDFAGLRPLPRPASVLVAASASRPSDTATADLGAQGASLAAQAEADLAAAAAYEAANPSVVAISRRPEARPRDLSRAVEAAVAAAVRAPEPEVEAQPEAEVVAAAAAPELKPEELDEVNEPETAAAAPKIPTKASVAKQATYSNAINLSKVNLIGTYGTDSKRYALIRQSNGRYKKVKVGDKIDGGTVKAITANEVRYQKGGKLLSLKMPKA